MLSPVRVLVLSLLVACGGGAASTPPPATPTQPTPPPPPPADAGAETFTGTITEIDFGCAADASCDLVVDGDKRVHFGHDTRLEGPSPWGNTEEVFALMQDPKQGVGRRVEVHAAKREGGGYTLQGNEAYYIKVLP